MAEAQDVTLFRKRSVSASRRRLLGPVCIVAPPTVSAAICLALTSLCVLAFVVCIVEVPQRARAIGVLMPAGGLLDVVATESGQVTDISVEESMAVREGQPLLRLTSDRNAPGRLPVTETEIRSLRSELDLMQRVHDREQASKSRQAAELEDQSRLTESRLRQANIELELQTSHVALLGERLDRMTLLASRGSVAADVLVQERSAVLRARSAAAGLERAVLEIRQELKSLRAKRDEIVQAVDLAALQHDMKREKLLRQIGRTEIEAGRVVLAPAAGIVARLRTRPGATSRPGETLMTLYKGDGPLEAWLYLPSDRAGQIKAGQAVQLRFDAYPHEMFGTLTAIVSKVSNIALLASDLAVPLPIQGPVFEVRASIPDNSIDAQGSSWPLAPGTSFRADVIRQRYRLYQWLLRSIWREDGDGDAIVGS